MGNWLMYVWAVMSGQCSTPAFGYFINLLVSVLLGTVKEERLQPGAMAAVALAAAGVLWFHAAHRQPAGGAGLAVSFWPVRADPQDRAAALEADVSARKRCCWRRWCCRLWPAMTVAQHGALTRGDPALTGWLPLSGLLTAAPLPARRQRGARHCHRGLVQYPPPSLQFAGRVGVPRAAAGRVVGGLRPSSGRPRPYSADGSAPQRCPPPMSQRRTVPAS